jgi:hypothetical protein
MQSGRRVRREARVGIASALRFAMVLVAVACSDGNDSKGAYCERVLDHMIDLRLADATGVDRGAHHEALKRGLGERFVSSCVRSMSSSQALCALEATSLAELNGCISGSTSK